MSEKNLGRIAAALLLAWALCSSIFAVLQIQANKNNIRPIVGTQWP